MKDFQSAINSLLKDHKKHKQYLAFLLALSMIVSVAVPFSLIVPAVSMTQMANGSALTLVSAFNGGPSSRTRLNNRPMGPSKPNTDKPYFESAATEVPDNSKMLNDGTDGTGNDISSIKVGINGTEYTNGTVSIPASGNRIDSVTFDVEYSFAATGSGITTANPCIYYQLPDGVVVPQNGTQYYGSDCIVMDGSTKAGYYSISEDGLVVIQLTDEYISDKVVGGGQVKGQFSFTGSIESADTATGDRTVEIGGLKLEIEFPDAEYGLDKRNGVVSEADADGNIVVSWEVTLSSQYLKDNPFVGKSLVDERLVGADIAVYDENNNLLSSGTDYTINGSTLTLNTNADSNGDNQSAIRIAYQEKLTKEALEQRYETDNLKINNTVTLNDENGSPIKSDNAEAEFQKPTVQKSGRADYELGEAHDQKIRWTIDVNSPLGVPLAGYTVQDEAFKAGSSVEVKDQNGSVIVCTLEDSKLTFPEDLTATKVTIVYDQDITDVSTTNPDDPNNITYRNTAKLLYPNNVEAGDGTVADVYYVKNPVTLGKDGSYDPDTEKITWTIQIANKDNRQISLNGYEFMDSVDVPLENIRVTQLGTNYWDNASATITSKVVDNELQVYGNMGWEHENDLLAKIVKTDTGFRIVTGDCSDHKAYKLNLSYETDKNTSGITETEGEVDGSPGLIYTNTVSDKYGNTESGVVGVGTRDTIEKQALTTPNFPTYSDKLTDDNRQQDLSWKVKLTQDQGYEKAIVDVISAQGQGEHYLWLPDQGNAIAVTAGNVSGTYDTTLISGTDYTVTFYDQDGNQITEGKAARFEIQFSEEKQTTYKYVAIDYRTTAVINETIDFNDQASINVVFKNQASIGDNHTPDQSVTVQINDANKIETMDLTVRKEWTNEDEPKPTHEDIQYIIERQFNNTGDWKPVAWITGENGDDEWVELTANEDGTYSNNGETVEPYTLGNSESWSKTWFNLPKETLDHNGNYQYRVRELNCPEGYVCTYSQNSLGGTGEIVITNKLYKAPSVQKHALGENKQEVDTISASELKTITKDGTEYYLFGWSIDVANLPNDAVVADTLPEGHCFYTDGNNGDYRYYYFNDGQNSVKREMQSYYNPPYWSVMYSGTDNGVSFKIYNSTVTKLIYYSYVPKSTVEDAIAANGSYRIGNTAEFEDAKSVAEVTVTKSQTPVPVEQNLLDKSVVKAAYGDETSVLVNGGKFTYSVIVNPEGKSLSNENTYSLTDDLKIDAFRDWTADKIQSRLTAEVYEIKMEELDPYHDLAKLGDLNLGSDYLYTEEKGITETAHVDVSNGFQVYIGDSSISPYNDSIRGSQNRHLSGEEITLTFRFQCKDEYKSKSVDFTIDGVDVALAFDENGYAEYTWKGGRGFEETCWGVIPFILKNGTNADAVVANVAVTKASIEKVKGFTTTRLNLTVPDEKALRITYTYQLYLDGVPVSRYNDGGDSAADTSPVLMTAGNTMSLDAGKNKDTDSADDTAFRINQSESTITVDGLPKIVKTDVGNYSLSLGAEFYIAKYDGTGWRYVTKDQMQKQSDKEWINVDSGAVNDSDNIRHEWTYADSAVIGTMVPDDAAKIVIDGKKAYQVKEFTAQTLYKIIEVKVPDDYEGSNLVFNDADGYNTLEGMLKAYLSGQTITNAAHKRFLEKYISTHYFTYGGNANAKPENENIGSITTINDDASLQIFNNQLIDLSACKTWSGASVNDNYQVKVELLWYSRPSSQIPEDAVLVTKEDLGLLDEDFNAEQIIKGNGSFKWSDLPNGKDDKPIYYYIRETAYSTDGGATWFTLQPDGTYQNSSGTKGDYSPIYSGNATNKDGSIVEITNSAGLSVVKAWKKSDGTEMPAASIPADAVQFKLYGVEDNGAETLLYPKDAADETNPANAVFTINGPDWKIDLQDAAELGDFRDFRIEECAVKMKGASEFRTDLSSALYLYIISDNYNINGQSGVITLTNKDTATTNIDVNVTKNWGDGYDIHATDRVTVQLYRSTRTLTDDEITALSKLIKQNNIAVTIPENLADVVTIPDLGGVETQAVLSPENDWKTSWADLPRKSDTGDAYTYYGVEAASSVPDGYETSYTSNITSAGQSVVITNAKPGSLNVVKNWSGEADTNSIEVELYRQAKVAGTTAENKPADFKVVAIGDSITNGAYNGVDVEKRYWYQLAQLLKENGYTTVAESESEINYGKDQEESFKMTERVNGTSDNKNLDWTQNYDVVCLLAGTNDALHGYASDFETNFTALLNAIYNKGGNDIVVLVGKIPYCTKLEWFPWDYRNQKSADGLIDSLNQTIVKVVNSDAFKNKNIQIVDINSVVDKDTMLYDGCHPNETGYKAIANAFYSAINEYYGGTTAVMPPQNINSVPTIDDTYEKVTVNGQDAWTITAADGWKLSIEGLAQADSAGNEYVYYIREKTTGYAASYTANGQLMDGTTGGTVTITNIPLPKGSLKLKKEWENNDGTLTLPDSVTVDIYRSATAPTGGGGSSDTHDYTFEINAQETITQALDAAKTISQMIFSIPKVDYLYHTIKFDDNNYVKIGYNGSQYVEGNEWESKATDISYVLDTTNGVLTIKFNGDYQPTQVAVKNEWYGNLTSTINLDIIYEGGGTSTGEKVEAVIPDDAELYQSVILQLSASGEWSTNLELPLTDAANTPYYYYIRERDGDGYYPIKYQVQVDGEEAADTNGSQLNADKTVTYTVTNHLIKPSVGSIEVEKKWQNDEGSESKRPGEITVNVYRSTLSPEQLAANQASKSIRRAAARSGTSEVQVPAGQKTVDISGLSAGDIITATLSGPANLTGGNGCWGYSYYNSDTSQWDWHQEQWTGDYDGSGTSIVQYTVPEGVTSVQLQVWHPNKDGEETHATVKSYNIKHAGDTQDPTDPTNPTDPTDPDTPPTRVDPIYPQEGLVGTITLTSDGSWKGTLADLALTDASGNPYYYYILEADPGGGYIPISYKAGGETTNASQLTENGVVTYEVTNYLTNETGTTMPSTGSTGTRGYTAAGVSIMVTSTAVYILTKRRRKKAS